MIHHREYYTAHEIAEVLGTSYRSAARFITEAPADLVRLRETGGRPAREVHFAAIPQLQSHFKVDRVGNTSEESATASGAEHDSRTDSTARSTLSPRDAAKAALRARAVQEYWALRERMTEARAAAAIVADWANNHRSREVVVRQRLGNNRPRKVSVVTVGGFSISTLRGWSRRYKEGRRTLEALAPRQKGRCGRARVHVPELFINQCLAYMTKNTRCDHKAAIAYVRNIWPTKVEACDSTIYRRMVEVDPERFHQSAAHSVARTVQRHRPDVEKDYNLWAFNEELQLDDVQMDFYTLAGDLFRAAELGDAKWLQIVRPYAYAVIRPSTRQWVAFVGAETKITEAQVRALVGCVLASKSGGIPDRMRFERGTTACSDGLEELLESLGCEVHRTSMNGGKVHVDAAADRASGHSQGKAIVEANFRSLHNRLQGMPAQVGTEERHTASARLQNVLRQARDAWVEQGVALLPDQACWTELVKIMMEAHNDCPHSGLPRMRDPETGLDRHMTPNEVAALKKEPLRVMEKDLLPLFYDEGERVKIKKNGFTINGESYGRWDHELQAMQGEWATVYAFAEMPEFAYVAELGRTVELYVKSDGTDEQFARSASAFKAKQNAFQQRLADARDNGGMIIGDTMRFPVNATPDRPVETVDPAALRARAAELSEARSGIHHDKNARDRDNSFDDVIGGATAVSPAPRQTTPDSDRPTRRSLSEQSALARRQIAASLDTPDEADDFATVFAELETND